MKKFFLILLAGCFFSLLPAQRFSYLTNGPIRENIPFVTAELFSFYLVPLQQDHFPENVRLRWLDGRGNASEWHTFELDDHADRRFVSTLGFAEKSRWTDFEIDMPASGPVTLYIYDPGRTPAADEPTGSPESSVLCFEPVIQERADWCPTGNCPVDATPAFTSVTHLIVHHSAGVNQSSDWAGVVRAIWDFHVNGNGWDDIGYNYLVDPNGVIYEGRGRNVRGAHFCGKNSNTMGNCLLGNFTNQLPTPAALESLAGLLAWKAAEDNIDPLAVTFHAGGNGNLISLAAHREGCATACPGDAFFPFFPAFRQSVADTLASCLTSSIGEEEPAWASEVIVSPNPGNGPVAISGLPAESRLELYTIGGQRLLVTEADNKTSVEARLSEAAAGVYLLRVSLPGEGGGALVRRVVRE